MSDEPTDKGDDKSPGTVLSFPDGQQLNANDVGAFSVVGQGGLVPIAEIVDTGSLEKDLRERDQFVRDQPLARAIDSGAAISDIIDEVMKEIAEELSHLKYERRKAAKEGKNTANYTISRIASLRQLADVLQKRQENARQEKFDLQSPHFKRILHLWLEFLYESMIQAGLNEGTIDSVLKVMDSNMTDWEKRVAEEAVGG